MSDADTDDYLSNNGEIHAIDPPLTPASPEAVDISPGGSIVADIDPDSTWQSRGALAVYNQPDSFIPSHGDQLTAQNLALIRRGLPDVEDPSVRIIERRTHVESQPRKSSQPYATGYSSPAYTDVGDVDPYNSSEAAPSEPAASPSLAPSSPRVNRSLATERGDKGIGSALPGYSTPRPAPAAAPHSTFPNTLAITEGPHVEPASSTSQPAVAADQPASSNTEPFISATLDTTSSATVQPTLSTDQPAAATAQPASSATRVARTRVQPVLEASDRVLRVNPKRTNRITEMASVSKPAPKRKAATNEGPSAKKARTETNATSSAATATPSTKKVVNNTKASSTSRAKKVTAPRATKARTTTHAPKPKVVNNTKASSTSRAKKVTAPRATKARTTTHAPKPKVVINHAPTQRVDVFVCGEGSAGELGLGNGPDALDVKRPRLNPNLLAREVGVVHIACGGMHAAALTHDNQILTWGVNDHGALGRDTTWDDYGDDDDDSTVGLNPHESMPSAVPRETFPPGTVFTQLACGDSATFALTDEGDVYGWGTFRCNDGIMGFSKDVKVQTTPAKLPKLSKITQIACGANHVLALKQNGDVYIWGSGEQNQLGHRVVERKRLDALTPTLLRLTKKCRLIGCGQDHSFAIQSNEDVWTWGLNNFGETGIREGAGGDGAVISYPVKVPSLALQNDTITSITGGAHHSAATTANGVVLIWGRTDGRQTGLDEAQLPEADLIRDQAGRVRILIKPTALPSGSVGTVNLVAVGTDHSICTNTNGEAWSWGFNANHQCGQGTDSDIEFPTLVANTAVRNRRLSWVGAGGQFSVFAAVAEE